MTHDARHTQGERELEKKRSLRLWLIASHSNAHLSLYFHTGTRAFLWLSQWPNRWRDSPSAMNDPSSSSPPHSVRVCTASPRKKTRRTTLRSLQNWSWIRFLRHGKNGAGLSSHSRLEKNHHKSYFVCHQSTVNYIRSYFFPLLSSSSILPTMRAVLLFFSRPPFDLFFLIPELASLPFTFFLRLSLSFCLFSDAMKGHASFRYVDRCTHTHPPPRRMLRLYKRRRRLATR